MRQKLNHDESEFFEERAAIGEFDGGWPRPIAESEARRALDYRRWETGMNSVNRWLEAPEIRDRLLPTRDITRK